MSAKPPDPHLEGQECRLWIAARVDRRYRLALATLVAVASAVIGVMLVLHGGA